MNLQKIKECEELKEELKKYGAEYEKLSSQKRHDYIVAAHNDFIDFFKEQGFEINNGLKEIEAIYGKTKVKIDKYNEDEWYMGCYATWDLSCTTNKLKYTIQLNSWGRCSTLKTKVGVFKKLSEDEKIDNEIEETKEAIKKIKKNIEEFDTFKLGYTLITKEGKHPQFESMKELLTNLFS